VPDELAQTLMHWRRIANERITHVGLDVYKETIAVALAEESKRGGAREHGKIANTPEAKTKLASKRRLQEIGR
jgi:hypothetical protein